MQEILFHDKKYIGLFCTTFKMVPEGLKFALFCTSGFFPIEIWTEKNFFLREKSWISTFTEIPVK